MEKEDYLNILKASFSKAEALVGIDRLGACFFARFFEMYPETKTFFAKTDVSYFSGKKMLIIYQFLLDVVAHPSYAEGQITEEVIRHQVYGLHDKEYYFALVDCLYYAVKQTLPESDWNDDCEQAWADVGMSFKAIVNEAASSFL